MRPVFFPYRIYSESARILAEALDTYCVYPDGKYRPHKHDLVIVWGSGMLPNWWRLLSTVRKQYLNHPHQVLTAINKLRTFQRLEELKAGVNLPKWTTSRVEALKWIDNEKTVVCRNNLTGSEGRGIVVCDGTAKLPEALLYTRHLRHRDEYRVHVFDGKVIDVAEKRRRNRQEQKKSDALIRSWRNGWVFCHEDVNPPKDVIDQALRAVIALELDFGAVDIGYHPDFGACVYEVNTAPGIEGHTVESYVSAFKQYLV